MTRAVCAGEDVPQSAWPRRVVWVALFAIAFGYLEAAVVVYLRVIYDPIRASLHPEQPADALLPLITLEELRAADPLHVTRLAIEVGRELATMIMLGAVAFLARRRRGEWIAFFMIAFGLWDIVFYVGLRTMIGFPQSLLTWDILFLIPLPWLAPVLAPVIVSITMIAAGLIVLAETAHGRPLRAAWYHGSGIALGALVIITSFCKDHERTMAGEMPGPFGWLIFAAGELIGLTAFVHCLARGRSATHNGRR